MRDGQRTTVGDKAIGSQVSQTPASAGDFILISRILLKNGCSERLVAVHV